MKKILIIGSGGHAKSCAEVIEKCKDYKLVGFVTKNKKFNKNVKILDYPVVASDKELAKLSNKFKYAIVGIGQIKNFENRYKIFKNLKKLNFKLPTIISPNAIVSKFSYFGSGCIVMQHAIVNADTEIGNNCIINNKALIEHDVKIGHNSHISTGAIINGSVEIGENCFIGSN